MRNKVEKQKALLAQVYDLILDTEVSKDERILFINFKNEVENNKDFETQLMKLAEELRKLAVTKYTEKKMLTPVVSAFYMNISSTGLLKKSLASG